MIALSVAKLKISAGKRNFSLNKAKNRNKTFCGKFGSMPTFRSTRKGKKCFFVMSLRLSDNKVVITQHRIFIKFFSISLGFSRFFRSNFVLQIFGVNNLIKKIFHSRLLELRLVIANSALRYLPSHIQRALME